MSEDRAPYLSTGHPDTIHTPAKNPAQEREMLWRQIEANRAAIRQKEGAMREARELIERERAAIAELHEQQVVLLAAHAETLNRIARKL